MTGSAPAPTLGIDLGTTNTVVAHNGQVLAIAPEGPAPTLLPSAVAFTPAGERLVGLAARARRLIDPQNTLLSTKRLIGAAYRSYRARRFAEHHAYRVVEGPAEQAMLRTRAGDLDPVDVAAAVLAEASRLVERDPRAHAAVITVPASFEDAERRATLCAARRAGFAHARSISEPVATAVAYLSRSNLRYAAVFDLGGGTFDLAVVDCQKPPLVPVAHAGDPYLGGDDVDRELALRVVERVLAEHRWDLGANATVFARLVALCEQAKLAIGGAESAAIDLASVDPSGPFDGSVALIERAELRSITADLVRRTFAICDLVLSDAGLKSRDIDAIFLAGGSTKLPGLADMVGAYFGKRPRVDIDPVHVVAVGASVAATRPAFRGLLLHDAAA